jgi:hypothetical protein
MFTPNSPSGGDAAQQAIQNGIAQLAQGGGGAGTSTALPQGGIKGLAAQLAAERGWSGAQWAALDKLVTRESSWNPMAQNPTSTAFGLFQFLDSTWGNYGHTKTKDPRAQILAGLDYIAQRYGDPNGAWNFWQKNHWY